MRAGLLLADMEPPRSIAVRIVLPPFFFCFFSFCVSICLDSPKSATFARPVACFRVALQVGALTALNMVDMHTNHR